MKVGIGIVLLCSAISLQAQIKGTIVDGSKQPIEGATVILQAKDSLVKSIALSGSDGSFILQENPRKYQLIIQHLLYATRQVECRGQNVDTIFLEPNDFILGEVLVKNKPSFVKVENGRLEYDLAHLFEGRVVNNVYEALARLPGIREDKDGLSLIGAGRTTVVIDGKPKNMDEEQFETFLRSMPVERVEKVEVMYSAPPEYHTRGAVVNVILEKSPEHSFQGEVNADYRNRYFNGGGIDANFRLAMSKITFDLMYGAENVKNLEYIDLYSEHSFDGRIYDIQQNERLSSKFWNHNLGALMTYNVDAKNRIDVAYTGNYIPRQYNESRTTGNYQTGVVDKYIDTRMHNVSLHYYSGFGLEVGGDYTHYFSDNNQNLIADFSDGRRRRFSIMGGQEIDRYSTYIDYSRIIEKKWRLGCGASYRFAADHDYQSFDEVEGNVVTENLNSHIREHTADFYLSVGKESALGVSWTVSATGEYYKMGQYCKWTIYPQASLTYLRTPEHVLQLSLSTDKTYPGYWDMQSAVSYLNGYTELWGTPGLKPMTTYNLNGNYVWRQKYIFGLFFTHTSDFFTQAAYQSTDRLALIYKNTNWDYMRLWGANVVLPFGFGGWFDSRLTLSGMEMHQRCDDFFDIPFDRRKWVFCASLDNMFKVGRNLSLELIGSIQTPAIQGTFDIGNVFDLTAGLKWSLADGRLTFSARCSDIFNTGMPNLKVRFKGQYLDMDNAFHNRALILHLGYRFGGYKKKNMKKVDTSRFGH